MTNSSTSPLIPNLFRAAFRLLPGTGVGENLSAAADRKEPPRLSLSQSFAEESTRRSGPSLAWFDGAQ